MINGSIKIATIKSTILSQKWMYKIKTISDKKNMEDTER